jgi:hypothetical protein
MKQPFFDTTVYKQTVKDQFVVLEDFDDETLIDELKERGHVDVIKAHQITHIDVIAGCSNEMLIDVLKERGYAVYKGADMQESIKKLEGLENGLIKKFKNLKGDK